MKKVLSFILAVCMVLGFSQAVFAENPIKIVIGGERLVTDVDPIITEGRTLLPVRAVFENIGAEVKWDEAQKKVTAVKDGKTVELVIGSNIMTVNGEAKVIDVPAVIVDNRTLVPVRACAEAFDLKVEWNENTRTVRIKKLVSVVSESKSGDVVTKYTYDERGNETGFESTNGTWVKYAYDENGNVIYSEDWGNYWVKSTYDGNGNLIYTENVGGYWEKYSYDENGNNFYWENSSGDWYKINYDENGNEIYSQHADGHWEKIEYNDMQKPVFVQSSQGSWNKYYYNENGVLVREESDDGNQHQYVTIYNENGDIISCTGTYGVDEYYEYDENRNLIHYNGYGESRYEYDSEGKLIFADETTRAGYNYQTEYTYDENGNLIYENMSNGDYTKYIVIER